MFVDKQDFACGEAGGVFSCPATSEKAKAIYGHLQAQLKALGTELTKARSDVPPNMLAIVPDGRIGPSTVLAAQYLLTTINRTVPVPPMLAALIAPTVSAQDAIKLTAINAEALNAFFIEIAKTRPAAFTTKTPEPTVTKVPSRVAPLLLKSAAAIGGGITLMIILAAITRKANRKAAGVEDGRHFLPPDQDDDDDDDEDDDDDKDEDDDDGAGTADDPGDDAVDEADEGVDAEADDTDESAA